MQSALVFAIFYWGTHAPKNAGSSNKFEEHTELRNTPQTTKYYCVTLHRTL